jgi:hypothetical protein
MIITIYKRQFTRAADEHGREGGLPGIISQKANGLQLDPTSLSSSLTTEFYKIHKKNV